MVDVTCPSFFSPTSASGHSIFYVKKGRINVAAITNGYTVAPLPQNAYVSLHSSLYNLFVHRENIKEVACVDPTRCNMSVQEMQCQRLYVHQRSAQVHSQSLCLPGSSGSSGSFGTGFSGSGTSGVMHFIGTLWPSVRTPPPHGVRPVTVASIPCKIHIVSCGHIKGKKRDVRDHAWQMPSTTSSSSLHL